MENNSTILANIWLNGTNDFQQRIPEPTQNNIASTVEALLNPMNNQYFNQFIDALIMRIGETYVHKQVFDNPLGVFKKSTMSYGATLQEIAVKWIKAHAYRDDAEDCFKNYRPDVGVWYHSQNRRDKYPITINRDELRSAFTNEYGLNELVSSLMRAPINADNYDEYRIMMELIAFYEQNFGFYKVQVSRPTSEETSKAFLKSVREMAMTLPFPSARYNAGIIPDIPVFAKQNELVLFTTPAVAASVDVDTLASVFNLDKAEVKFRQIIVDEFPIPNAVALLTTEDFFVCKDTEYGNASIYNPSTLGVTYFLHHWGIYSVSPFVPAILYTTSSGTTTARIGEAITGVTLTPKSVTASPGDIIPIAVKLSGELNKSTDGGTNWSSIDDGTDGIYLKPDSVIFDKSIVRPQTGRAGVYKFSVGGTIASNDKITIHGTEVTSTSTSPSTFAGAVRTALANDQIYTVSGSGANIILTEKTGYYGIGIPEYSITSTAGTLTAETTTEPISTTKVIDDIFTFVDSYGNLHISDNLQANDVITVTGTTTHVNPSDATTQYTDDCTVTIV